ncbi:MAG: MATE family efflux transporter, partial [Clostridia bacterium]|nr:MATE family efflux transporter [Clostridia bacterium]
MDSEIFEKLPPTKLFFRCAVPSMITMAFGALYQIADGIFVGRFIGGDALAAINLIMPIIMTVFAFANMIATGASVRIGVLLGEKKQQEASQAFSSSLKIIFLVGIILGILGYFFAKPFVRFLSPGATENAVLYGVTYIRMYAVFSPFLLLSHALDNFLRVCGKEKLSMWLSIIFQGLNIVLDIILIAFLGQGIWAAAFTSCISMALAAIISIFIFRKKRLDLYYTRKNIRLKEFLKILANGSSEFFSNISMSVMSIGYNFFLLKYGGTTAVAAFSVIMYVDSIIGMLVFGMCDAMQPALSYCYGAKLFEKIKALLKRIVIASLILSALSTLFMFFLGPIVAPIFVKPEDTDLLKVSIIAMKFFSLSYMTGWIDMCFSSVFTALERPARSFVTSLFGTIIFPFLFLFILPNFWDLNGVWLTPLFSCTVSAMFTFILIKTMKLQ